MASMSDTSGYNAAPQQQPQVGYYPVLPREALTGVRTRRVVAVLLDMILVGLISFLLFLLIGVATLGIGWLFLPSLPPIVAFFYNGMTVSGWRMATPGMKAMDLEVRQMNGQPAPFINAAVQGVLFWLSWYLTGGLILLVSLIMSDKRCLHDILSGLIVVRRAS